MQRKKMLLGKMGRNHDITLTPRDFNYDNHHYQYLKYTKRGKVSPLSFPTSLSPWKISREVFISCEILQILYFWDRFSLADIM